MCINKINISGQKLNKQIPKLHRNFCRLNIGGTNQLKHGHTLSLDQMELTHRIKGSPVLHGDVAFGSPLDVADSSVIVAGSSLRSVLNGLVVPWSSIDVV